jgi:hypothetical protein
VLPIVLLASALVLAVGAAPAVIAAGNPIGDRFVIRNDATPSEVQPAVAYNSARQEYLVVWQAESPGPVKEVWGQRVSGNGTLLGSAFRISPANGGYNPDVAYNGTINEYMVVYETGGNILGQRVSNTGGLTGSEIKIAAAYVHGAYHYHNPAVAYASTANRYLVAYQYNWDLDGSTNIRARAYLSDGSPEDYEFEVGTHSDTTLPDLPDLAYNRSRDEFLVVWQQTWSPGDRDIRGRRVTMSGGASVSGSAFYVIASGDDEINPAVAAIPTVPNQGQYLVAWESVQDVEARTVSGTGTLGALRILADTAWGEYSPAVAGCESNQQFLAVWMWIPSPAPPAMMQVYGRAIALDGTLLGAGNMYISGRQVYNPAVASGPAGDFLVAFDDTEWVGPTPYRGVYGQLWGNHVYMPLVLRSY